jgi:two-component system, cell cycle sensor histidine kinase and response regulator CckA
VPQRFLTFEQIVELSNEGIWVLDENGLACYVNPRAAEIFGYTPGEVVGRPVDDFLFDEDRPRYEELLAGLKASRSRRIDGRFRHRDGRAVWALVSARTLHAADDRFVGVFGMVSDVTDRREAIAALRRSEERYRLISENSADVIWTFDIATHRLTFVSPAVERLRGWTAEEVMAQPLEEVLTPESLQRAEALLVEQMALEPGVALVSELDQPCKDGSVVPTEVVTSLIHDENGQPITVVGITRDITERRRQEEDRRRLEARLLQGQKLESLGVLAGGVAHEFNNLLTSILGNADLSLQDLPPDSPVREHIRAIETASRRAAEISHQMLAYSGRGRFVVERANVSRVVRDMARMLEISVPKVASLRFELPDGLPPVEADVTLLRQMVLNLVLNAAEATDPRLGGTIVVRTGVETCGDDSPCLDYFSEPIPRGHYLFVEVSDTGGGMDAATVSRIFDPFFSTKFTGRGLGLPAALGVVRGHRGFIKVRSQVGHGSTFKVMLPALAVHASTTERESARPVASALPLILVVDDEDSVRTLTVRLLERCGYRAVGAADGVEALAVLRARYAEFSCVLLDLTMPRLSGEDTLRELRVFAPILPVLISSGYEGNEVSQRLESLHVAGFIQKPYQLADLKARLDAVLASTRT